MIHSFSSLGEYQATLKRINAFRGYPNGNATTYADPDPIPDGDGDYCMELEPDVAHLVGDWLFPDRPFRFSVPLALLFSGQQIWASFAIYADKKGIPYEELQGDLLRYYAAEVYPDHQQLLASAGIQIEQRP